ncbi:MAG TPA: PHP domain-containing protein [Candidatus Nanoarchaeia archaeon]|nr:PHP domain-containing protein [Candidatus Nanoarchaeia archaeon]
MIERIQFAKPMLKHLKEDGFLCADMHFHTKYSDTFTRPKSIVKLAAKRRVGVAITDHNHIKGCIEAHKENKRYRVNIINGIEVSTKQGPHLLVYFYSVGDMKEFYERYVDGKKGRNPYMILSTTAEDIVKGAKENNGIVSAAHPRALTTWDIQKKVERGDIDRSIFKSIDCAEVICGILKRKMNLRAVEWAQKKGMGITGGSDGHTLFNLGSVVTYSKTDTVNSFLDSVRKKKSFVAGTESRMFPRAISMSKAASKHARYIGPSMRIYSSLQLQDSIWNIKEKIKNGRARLRAIKRR